MSVIPNEKPRPLCDINLKEWPETFERWTDATLLSLPGLYFTQLGNGDGVFLSFVHALDVV
jgi:hypothetical protein